MEAHKDWTDIKEYPEYEISRDGLVRDKKRKRVVPHNYPSVNLVNSEGKVKRVTLHRLVAKTFIEKPEREEELIVNHKDGNKQNFAIDNLEWITRSENNIHAYQNGLNYNNKNGWGSNNKPIVGLYIESEEVKQFGGIRVATRELGIHGSVIRRVIDGKSSHAEGWYFMDYDQYTETGFPEVIKPVPRFNKKAVQQISPSTGEVLHTFETAREAAASIGCPFSKISLVCNGKRKTSGGYKWKFVDA